LKKLTAILDILFYTTLISEILPLFFCFLFFNKLSNKRLKAFFVYALMISIFSFLSIVLIKVLNDKVANFLVFRIFSICEFSIISIFLLRNVKNYNIKRIITINIYLFILFALIDYAIFDKTRFNNHSSIVSSLVLIAYIVYFFYEKMKTVVVYPLYQSISFWICVGFFLYFSGTYFCFLLSQSTKDPKFISQLNLIYGLVTLSKNLILSMSLFTNEQDESILEDKLEIPININLDEISLTNYKNS